MVGRTEWPGGTSTSFGPEILQHDPVKKTSSVVITVGFGKYGLVTLLCGLVKGDDSRWVATRMVISRMKAKGAAEASLDLCLPRPLLGLEGQRTLKLEERMVQLFDELRTPMFRYLLCLSVNPAEADEIIQETFLKLFKHLHLGGREDNLRSWIFRVAHNMALNQRKARKHWVPSNPEQWAELNESRTDPAPNPEELLLQKERINRVHATMSILSAQQLQCVHLRAEGFRYREIAEILGVSISTVAESLRGAIDKLTRESNG